MATASRPPKFKPSDLVKYKDQGQYIVLSITNILGFNKYNIINIQNGEYEQAAIHEISKLGETIFNKENEEMEESDDETEEKKKRFPTLQPEDLDKIAQKRTEKATDKQTAWAIKIFKGNRHFFSKYTCTILNVCKQTL